MPCALVAVLLLCGCCLAGEARPERAFDAPYGVFIGMRGGEALRDERVRRRRVGPVKDSRFRIKRKLKTAVRTMFRTGRSARYILRYLHDARKEYRAIELADMEKLARQYNRAP